MIDLEIFFHKETSTLTYIVYDTVSCDAIIIDPVLDYDPETKHTSTAFIDTLVQWVNEKKLHVHAALETHVHADHITGTYTLKQKIPGLKNAISHRIDEVCDVFGPRFSLSKEMCLNQFDLLLKDWSTYTFGSIKLQVLPTPGHTPACLTFKIENMLFTGDSIFMPDFGTGRCDFPKGSAKDLFHSVSKTIYGQEDDMKIYVGHDYQPKGRALRFQTSVGEEKLKNIHIKHHTTEEEFVTMREKRDSSLQEPKLLLISLKANLVGGRYDSEGACC